MPTRTRVHNTPGLDRSALVRAYRLMLLSRSLDEAEVKLKRHQKTFFQLSGAGHEAVQTAASLLLKPGYDWFYPYYRDRTLCLGLGVKPIDTLLQAMGKASDPSSGGREMPCHFGCPGLHIVNQSSPTGTQYLQAVGTAEAGWIARIESRRQAEAGEARDATPGSTKSLPSFERDEVVFVSGGEGSCSEGEFFEAVSAASLRRLPMLFLLEDNEFAISVPSEHQTPGGSVSALVRGFPHFYVEELNGLDLFESYTVLKRALAHVRSGEGPALVHAHVVRLRPHSDSDDDRLYRPPADKASDISRDPLPALEEILIQEAFLSPGELEQLRAEVREEVTAAVDAALLAPPPEPSDVTRFIYNPATVVTEESAPATEGQPITIVQAINLTLEREMRRDPRIVVFGEDVADVSRSQFLDEVTGKGGVFKVTHGLQRKFGDHRVFNTPIAEAAIVGRALGMAVRGLLPVAEIQFFDYIWPAMQQLRNELSVLRWRSNNTFSAPLVLRVPTGGYLTGGGIYHSQSGESIFCHCPGLRVVLPSCARDAAGLLRTALQCGDPVLFLEHKHLYRQSYARSPDPGPDYAIPLGKAATVRSGSHLSIVTFGALVEKSLRAADELAAEGVECEVIDLRSLQPYDWDAIAASIRKTNRVVVAYEDTRSHGFGAEIAARVAEELFTELDAPVTRVAALDAPVGYSPVLEEATLPQVRDIVEAARAVARF
ncbi:MAG TPA: dehydrogenase E1 component subunit alpha/beta [Planctomycetota bacterium]|nr:dehydrogenase E1 component subunit alpha/beta [Planctomycetota bacterium]